MSRRPLAPFDTEQIEDPNTLCNSLPDNPNHNPSIDDRVEYPEALDDYRDIIAGHCRLAIQEGAETHPLFTFAYNVFADNGFSNNEFIGYEQDTVVCLMGHLIDSDARGISERLIRKAAIECLNLNLLSMLGKAERDGYFEEIYDDEVERNLDTMEDSARDAEFFMNVFADELQRNRNRGRRDRYDDDDYDDRAPRRSYPTGGVRTGGSRSRSYPTGGRSTSRRTSSRGRSTGRRGGTVSNIPATRFPGKEQRREPRRAAPQSRSALYGGPTQQGAVKPQPATQTKRFTPSPKAQPAPQNEPTPFVNQPGVTWYVDPNNNDLPYGTILGVDAGGVPIVKCRPRKNTVSTMVEEEDMLGDGPVDVVKFGGDTAVRQEKAQDMSNDIGMSYDRKSRTAKLFSNGKNTTRYDVDEPTRTDKYEVPNTVSDLVIDPFYYSEPEDPSRPYDHFYNPGDIEIWSRQAFFKRAGGKLQDAFTRPLRAFNPYEEVAFIAVWPGDEVRLSDIIVKRKDDMEYLTHELRAELRGCKRLADSEVIINEEVPTFQAITGKETKQIDVSDASTRNVKIYHETSVMSPVNALTSVECALTQASDDNTVPENYIFNTVEALDFVQTGVDKPRIFKSIKNSKTFIEVADRMVQYAEDGLLDEPGFRKLDELFKVTVNRALKEQYACNASIKDGFFVDAINDASEYVDNLYGEKGKAHWAKFQRELIASIFKFEEVVTEEEEAPVDEDVETDIDSDEIGDDSEDSTVSKDDIFADDNVAKFEEVEDELDELIKGEYADAEKRVHLLRSELITTNLRVEISSQAFTSINVNEYEGGQVLPRNHFPNLCKLIHLIKRSQPNSVAYNVITKDGVVYRAYIGIDDLTVILALAS